MSEHLKLDHNQLIALGDYIRSKRIQKKMSLREVAGKIDISYAYLSNLESGKHSKANPLVLKRLAKELGVDHLTLYKIVGYTNKDLDDIQKELAERSVAMSEKDRKIEKMTEYMRKFSDEEFELVEQYLKLLKKR